MQAKRVRCVCEFSLIYLRGFLTGSDCLASASSVLPRSWSRENCLAHITAYNYAIKGGICTSGSFTPVPS